MKIRVRLTGICRAEESEGEAVVRKTGMCRGNIEE